jgi:hypothetical protein
MGRPCSRPTCEHLQPCPVHARPQPQHRHHSARERRGRAAYLAAHPVCEWKGGCAEASAHCDHVKPWPYGPDDPSNYQALCHSHHSLKTARESELGGLNRGRS